VKTSLTFIHFLVGNVGFGFYQYRLKVWKDIT